MRDWLTIELVLGVLLVTTFASVGLLALWAATSPRHWFIRVAVVLAALSPLLLIPASEPLLALLLQSAIIVLCSMAWQKFHSRKCHVGDTPTLSHKASAASKTNTHLRYSLIDLMLAVVVAAVVVTGGAKTIREIPSINWETWKTIAINGLFSGTAVLLGVWVSIANRMWLAIPVALAVAATLAGIYVSLDWFVFSAIYQTWPPSSSTWQQFQQAGFGYPLWRQVALVSMGIAGTLMLISFLICCLWTKGGWPRYMAITLYALITLVPASMSIRLATPAPIPYTTLPEPNGWDALVDAGRAIESGSPLLNTAVEPRSTEQLASEVAKFAPTYRQIRFALAGDAQPPVWPTNASADFGAHSIPLDELMHVRTVARALMRDAALAEQQGRFSDAAKIAAENFHFARICAKDALLLHWLVANGVKAIGQSSLYQVVDRLDDDSCRQVIVDLLQLDRSREPLAEVRVRDRIWDENAYGWWGCFSTLCQDLLGTYGSTHDTVENLLAPRTQAINRLLVMGLALRRYQLQKGTWPETLDDLVPAFLQRIPIDPFDVNGASLRYLRTGDGYVLYSVGSDGDDDGGRTPEKDEFGSVDWTGDGDLRLDVYFAPEKEPNSSPTSTDATTPVSVSAEL